MTPEKILEHVGQLAGDCRGNPAPGHGQRCGFARVLIGRIQIPWLGRRLEGRTTTRAGSGRRCRACLLKNVFCNKVPRPVGVKSMDSGDYREAGPASDNGPRCGPAGASPRAREDRKRQTLHPGSRWPVPDAIRRGNCRFSRIDQRYGQIIAAGETSRTPARHRLATWDRHPRATLPEMPRSSPSLREAADRTHGGVCVCHRNYLTRRGGKSPVSVVCSAMSQRRDLTPAAT